METINEQIRNKLSPVTNVIALIDAYQNTMNGEDSMKILNQIIKSKQDLKNTVKELLKIE